VKKVSLLLVLLAGLFLLAGFLLTACATSQASSGQTASLDGAALLQQRCTVCHEISGISNLHGSADQWKMLVDQMVSRGAQLNSQESQTLVTYLAQKYP
jgi:mono/diheme cytochrome c family protein